MNFYRHILLGREFIILTDHFSLTYLISQQKTPQHRIARWIDTLAEYNFRIKHLSGSKNTVADALSRVPRLTAGTAEENEEEDHFSGFVSAMLITTAAASQDYAQWIREALPQDPDFAELYVALTRSDPSTALTKEIRATAKHYSIIDNLLYYSVTVGSENTDWRLCIPAGFLRTRLLAEAHDAPFSGHFSFFRSYLLLAAKYYWPRMYVDMRQHVRTCDVCQRVNKGHLGVKGLLQPLDVPEQRWESISMDFITGFPKVKGFDGLLVVVDRLTKRAHFIPHKKSASAKQVIEALFWNVFKLHGVPLSMVSDRDSKFTSEMWQSVMQRLGIQLKMSTSNHAATDGQTERVNRIIKKMFQTHYLENQDIGWYDAIPLMEFAYNNSFQESIGCSPFRADLGIQPRIPSLIESVQPVDNPSPEVEEFEQLMEATLVRIRDAITEAQRKQERNANAHRSELLLKRGDKVLVRFDAFLRSANYKKIRPLYCGPYKVLRSAGDNAYRLDFQDSKRKSMVNVKFLKPYYSRNECKRVPPQSEEEATHFKHLIKEIVGYDQYEGNDGRIVQIYDLSFKECDPSIFLTVSSDFFLSLPAKQRKALLQDFDTQSPLESETILTEGGDSVTELV